MQIQLVQRPRPIVLQQLRKRAIRQQPWGRDVLLIALTGWGAEEDRRGLPFVGQRGGVVRVGTSERTMTPCAGTCSDASP